MRKRFLIVLILFVICLAIASPALASTGIFSSTDSNCINYGNCVYCDLLSLVSDLIHFAIFYLAIPIIALILGWGGWLLITSGGNPAQKEKAKKLIYKVITGLILMLMSWLIVNSFLTTLAGGSGWSTNWNTLQCIRPSFPIGPSNTANNSSSGGLSVGNATGGSCSTQCSNSNCSTSALQQAGFSPNQAAVMSGIAQTENPTGNICNGNACGTFQIMLSINPLSGSACNQYSVTNCSGASACNSGKNVSSSACTSCIAAEKPAALDPLCNAESAAALVNSNPSNPYGPWTTYSDNQNSAACVQAYSI